MNPGSGLHEFKPDTVLFALDAHHLMQPIEVGQSANEVTRRLTALLDTLAGHWETARRSFGAHVIQNVPAAGVRPAAGQQRAPAAGLPHRLLARLNACCATRRTMPASICWRWMTAPRGRPRAWHDPALWHRAKQEIAPAAAPLYGDWSAGCWPPAQGRSRKCLVLDLDNTLWGGVIGDDGLDGIVLGQGSALGEAFLAFQHYARELRGAA